MALGYRSIPTLYGMQTVPTSNPSHPFGPGVPWHMVNGAPVRGKSDAMLAKDATAALTARSAGLAGYYAGAPPTPAAATTMGVIPGVTPGYTTTNTVIDAGGVPTAAPGYTQDTPGAAPQPTPETQAAINLQKFNTWLAGDPTYQSGVQSAHNTLRDLIRTKLIAAGIKLDPNQVQSELSGYGDSVDADVSKALGEALDPETLATAAGNPTSAMANLSNALSAGQTNLRNTLAARGLLGVAPTVSGAFTSGQNVLDNAYNLGTQALLPNLIASIRAGVSGSGGYVPTVNTALTEAGTRYSNLPV